MLTGLVTGYGTEARRLWTTPYNPNLTSNDFHIVGPIKKDTVGKQFANVANVKQAVTYLLATDRHFTLMSYMLGYKPCCHRGTNV